MSSETAQVLKFSFTGRRYRNLTAFTKRQKQFLLPGCQASAAVCSYVTLRNSPFLHTLHIYYLFLMYTIIRDASVKMLNHQGGVSFTVTNKPNWIWLIHYYICTLWNCFCHNMKWELFNKITFICASNSLSRSPVWIRIGQFESCRL